MAAPNLGPPSVLRAYQLRLANIAEARSTIVLLPTGAGKTLIAAEVAKRIRRPVLFLVPTVLLVEQQAAAVRSWTRLNVAEYMGGARLASSFEVLVSTPKAFEAAQLKQEGSSNLLSWASFGLVVFDEVRAPVCINRLLVSYRRLDRFSLGILSSLFLPLPRCTTF